MCTAIAKKGNDTIFGYNLDIDPSVWNFKLRKTPTLFSVVIKVGSTSYCTHGVNNKGQFANLPYMNGAEGSLGVGQNRYRLDLLVDRYIKGILLYDDVVKTVRLKTIVNLPNNSMHSLFGDKDGHILLVEPGLGFKEYKENFAVVSNFPLLVLPESFDNQFYGKDRYDKAVDVLSNSGKSFSVSEALSLLESVKQTGQWGTRLSFVYSKNENTVYYCEDGNFHDIHKWPLN